VPLLNAYRELLVRYPVNGLSIVLARAMWTTVKSREASHGRHRSSLCTCSRVSDRRHIACCVHPDTSIRPALPPRRGEGNRTWGEAGRSHEARFGNPCLCDCPHYGACAGHNLDSLSQVMPMYS
jgi:hypothetical protein